MSSTSDAFDEFKSRIQAGMDDSDRDRAAKAFADAFERERAGRPDVEFGRGWVLQALRNNLLFLGYEIDPSDEREIVRTAIRAIHDLRSKGPIEESLRRAGRYADGALRAALNMVGIVLEEVSRG